MNYLTESNNEALNHLLEEKAFDQLTREEQAAVLAEMSESEYRQLRSLTQDVRSVLSHKKELIPRENIRMNVRQHVLNQPTKSTITRKKMFRSTIIQIAAAIALLVIGIQLTTRTSRGLIPGNQKNGEFIDSTSTDSAMQHKSGPNEDTVLTLEERIGIRYRFADRSQIAALREEREGRWSIVTVSSQTLTRNPKSNVPSGTYQW